MAWRELGKKRFYMNFTRALTTTSFRHAVGSSSGSIFTAQCIYTSASCIPDFTCHSSVGVTSFFDATKVGDIRDRCLHASPAVWARRGDEAFGLKTPKKEKYVRGDNRNHPPVDSPFVPRNVKATKFSPDKSVEIFEGMTLVELAKRTGKSVSSLQDIPTNVGEKVETEFDPLSIDIAELAAMEVGINVKRLHSAEGTEIVPRPPVVTVMGHVDHR